MRAIIYFVILFLLGNFTTYSQIIAKQSFEVSGDTWTPITFSTPPCTVGNDRWDYSTSLNVITPNDGNQFWGIQDLRGNCGGSRFESITLPNVNISSSNDIVFSFDFYVIRYRNNDDIKYELFYDNVSQGEVLLVDGFNNSGNGVNSDGWLTETVNIPSSVTNLSVVISVKQNDGTTEFAGIDNIRLESIPPPVNNDCNSATTLTVGANNTQNVITETNVGVTSSGQLPSPSCANYQGNDIWYIAQVPTSGNITIETQDAGSNIDTGLAVYSGSCGNLTEIACDDDINFPSNLYSKVDITDLPNTTIYIRVWAYGNLTSGNFNIVAYDVTPPAPANNNCIDAVSLTVGTDNTQNVLTGTNINSTDSVELPTPSCANYNGNDVWYTAQVPASGVLNIETQNAGSNIDTGLAIYTGSCGSLTQVACDDDSGSRLYSTINLTGLSNTTVYIRVWSWNNETSGNFNIVAYSSKCPLTTRWNNSGWNNGAPNSFTTAIINSNYDTATDGSFESCDCQINSSRTVNVRANDYITVHNDLTVNGILEVRHQGSLLMTNDSGKVSVSGTFNAHKTSTALNNYRDFTFWSSPVNTTIEQTFGGSVDVDPVNPNRIFEFNINNNTWDVASDNMIKAKGYIAEAPNTTSSGGTHSVIFTGAPNNGIVDISAVGNNKFNLIGNPYPSAINIDNFIQSNNIMDGTIWLWTHYTPISNGTSGDFLGDDYATYNLTGGTVTASSTGSNPDGAPTNNIASGQGFFVKATNSGTLSFQNDMRLQSPNAQLFRASDTKNTITKKKDRIWLNVESNTGGAFNQLLVGFFDQATDGVDRGFDGEKVSASWISFYSKINNDKYTIQGLPRFNIDKKITLGFDTYIDQLMTYKMSIDNIEGILNDTGVYIVDNELGITHDLKQADYEFDIDGSGNFPDRFTLQFTSSVLDIDDLNLDNNFIIANESNSLQLRSSTIITNLKIYDMMGRLLIDSKPNDSKFSIHTSTIKKGTVLILNATFDNGAELSKKVIRI